MKDALSAFLAGFCSTEFIALSVNCMETKIDEVSPCIVKTKLKSSLILFDGLVATKFKQFYSSVLFLAHIV